MRLINTFSVLFLSFILIPNFLGAQNSNAAELDSLMHKVHKMGIFNGNILVMQKGSSLYSSSFGFANGAKKDKLTPDYRFNIGSIAKEFNAVGIMLLNEQGKLSLDDKVSELFNYFPEWSNKVSVKNLLQYTSGLPDVNWSTVKSDEDVLADLKKVDKLRFEPGTDYHYNNNNTFLQRKIIEKVSGMSFHKFVENYMLKPCKMKSSVVDPDLHGKNMAIAFDNEGKESPRQFSSPMSGWTSTTAADLYQWSQCLHSFKVISKPSFLELAKGFSHDAQSGLGHVEISGDSIKEHFHHGSSGDFEALLYTDLSKDISIILLTNNKNSKLFEIKDAVKAIVEGKPYTVPKRSVLTAIKGKIKDASAEEIISIYNEEKSKHPDYYGESNENDFNSIGYSLLKNDKVDDAIKIFQVNVQKYPTSTNAYDSLAEALYKKGDKKQALDNYKKILQLDPENVTAKKMVEKIKGEI